MTTPKHVTSRAKEASDTCRMVLANSDTDGWKWRLSCRQRRRRVQEHNRRETM